jgi:hypothetical protein
MCVRGSQIAMQSAIRRAAVCSRLMLFGRIDRSCRIGERGGTHRNCAGEGNRQGSGKSGHENRPWPLEREHRQSPMLPYALANAWALHLAQGRFNSPPSLRLLCVPLLLELAGLLRSLHDRQVTARRAQLASVLLDIHHLHAGSSMLWAM